VIHDKLLIAISESRKLRRKSVRYPVNAGLNLGHKRVTAAERKRQQRNLLPRLKIFLQKRLPQKGYPLSGAETVFGQVFVRGGMTKISKWKVPPTGGSSAP
jgi:hypothetical protein